MKRSVGLAMVMVIGLVGFGLPTPASATTQVFSCHIDYSSYWVKAWCDYGLGGVRAAGYCWDGYGDVAYYGPWKPAGQVSEMICGGGRVLDGAWYETW